LLAIFSAGMLYFAERNFPVERSDVYAAEALHQVQKEYSGGFYHQD
jgi:hypothetical protein